MRIDVQKFLFMGAARDKKAFFEAAQLAGVIEFIDPKGAKRVSHSPEVQRFLDAIKVLRTQVHEEQDHKTDLDKATHFAGRILELKEAISSCEVEIKATKKEIERIAPFGEFSLEELLALQQEIHRKIRFFCAKSSKRLDEVDSNLILVNRKEGLDYFIAILNEPLIHHDLLELHFSESLPTLQQHLDEVSSKLEQSRDELKSLTRYYWLLHQALLHNINKESLAHAKESSEFEIENQLFYIEGWVPERHLDELKEVTDQYNVYFEEVAPYAHEKPPTYLENQGVGKVGEDLVRVFDTPSFKDKDPSLWVIFAFALFFSMIVYDGGYGLVFLVAALFMKFNAKKPSPQTKRFIALTAVLAVACTLWGGLTHSFFGIQLSENNFFRKHSLMTWLIEKKASYHMVHQDAVYKEWLVKYPQLQNSKSPEAFIYAHNPIDGHHHPVAEVFTDNILMELALLIGSLHICLGLMRYMRYNPSGVGWIAFIIGGYLYIPYYLGNTSVVQFLLGFPSDKCAHFGIELIIFGLLTATVIGVIQHGIAGIFEFMHSIQVFADVLSYLRLYALGLAGFIVSETVNELALKMPLLLTILLMIFGHFLNILLAIMGGTIHGLRLNFLEWYRYSFYGGGKEFQPLRLQKFE
ncbi:MAG: V-type ATP synthase subunit I [Verrucomicrobia bacterium]|nr:V-type ATP synthase subunit I [Verrucomicrobiota bacterium]